MDKKLVKILLEMGIKEKVIDSSNFRSFKARRKAEKLKDKKYIHQLVMYIQNSFWLRLLIFLSISCNNQHFR